MTVWRILLDGRGANGVHHVRKLRQIRKNVSLWNKRPISPSNHGIRSANKCGKSHAAQWSGAEDKTTDRSPRQRGSGNCANGGNDRAGTTAAEAHPSAETEPIAQIAQMAEMIAPAGRRPKRTPRLRQSPWSVMGRFIFRFRSFRSSAVSYFSFDYKRLAPVQRSSGVFRNLPQFPESRCLSNDIQLTLWRHVKMTRSHRHAAAPAVAGPAVARAGRCLLRLVCRQGRGSRDHPRFLAKTRM